MAQRVPQSFLSVVPRPLPPANDAPAAGLFRLAQHHRDTLRDVAQGTEESDAGLCCSYLVDSAGGEGRDFDAYALNALENYAERALCFDVLERVFGQALVRPWRLKLARARRTIARLRHHGEHHAANVLMVHYGHPDPLARQLPELEAMGALGSLARYTDATEERRLELVRHEAATPNANGVVDLAHYAARVSAADRTLSSSDALRAALAPFAEIAPAVGPLNPAEHEARRGAWKARRATHEQRRDQFVTQLRIETVRMLSAAERSYHHAWLASLHGG